MLENLLLLKFHIKRGNGRHVLIIYVERNKFLPGLRVLVLRQILLIVILMVLAGDTAALATNKQGEGSRVMKVGGPEEVTPLRT